MALVWERRLQRVRTLARRPAAAVLLGFLQELLPLQRGVAEWALKAGPWPAVRDDAPPRLRLERLPASDLQARFADFLRALQPHAPEVLAEAAGKLAADDGVRQQVLARFAAAEALVGEAARLGCDDVPLAALAQAFLAAVVEALAEGGPGAPDGWSECFCPICGRLPQRALLLDDGEIKGRRLLECSLCAGRWRVPRGGCLHCAEADPDKLVHHVSEDWPHVRVDECRSCRAYLKTLDLRRDPAAIPLVDELAAVELDLWAAQQGLWKIQANWLGL